EMTAPHHHIITSSHSHINQLGERRSWLFLAHRLCKSNKSEESQFRQLAKKSLNKEIARRGGCSRPLPLRRSPSWFSPLLDFFTWGSGGLKVGQN
ncbi:MAG: hypothetical protein LBH72_03845, partial [Proteiniphilum sp.]|nr:hypothetical protein [Proteiniphilum sp.]